MHGVLTRLNNEHKNISRLLDILEGELRHLEGEADVNLQLMRDIVDYMASYTDIFHHPAEDVVYGKLLQRAPEAREQIERIVLEHRTQSQLTHDFLGMLNALLAGDFVTREPVRDMTREYVTINRNHINLEEGEIFPLIKVTLSEDDWVDVDAEVHKGEDPLFGTNVAQTYYELYERLAREEG